MGEIKGKLEPQKDDRKPLRVLTGSDLDGLSVLRRWKEGGGHTVKLSPGAGGAKGGSRGRWKRRQVWLLVCANEMSQQISDKM